MSGKFYADDMAVRFADGKPLCVTSHSLHLDNADGYAMKSYTNRQRAAEIIAEALNQYYAKHDSGAQPCHMNCGPAAAAE